MRDRRATAVLPNPIAAAREAYVRGDLDAVCSLLGDRRLGAEAPLEGRLLRARALLRLQRPADVVDELRAEDLHGIVDVDERTTAWMLHGSAIARLDNERGRTLLADVAAAAVRERAHIALRAEISHYRAMASWSAGALDEAERFATEAERSGRDVLAVRAMQLRGFIAASRQDPDRYATALDLFRAAFRAYGRCRERDVVLASVILAQIASLEQTLRSAAVTGSHRGARARTLPGASFGPAVPSPTRLRLYYHDAWLFALDGADIEAFRMMRAAHELVSAHELVRTPAWEVWARAVRAAIAVVCGEAAGARTFADSAAELASTVDWNATRDDERIAFVHLAEVYAYLGDAAAAERAFVRFNAITAPVDNAQVLFGPDPRFAGWIAHVRGLLLRARGEFAGAGAAFTSAVEAFRSCRYLWREALSLIELDATPGSGAGGAHLDLAVGIIRTHFPHSFVARRVRGWAQVALDPVLSTLTPAERDVLRHLLEGRSKSQIAEDTGRSYNTVRTQVGALHRKVGTSSEHQLVAECARRGVGPPSWFEGRKAGSFDARRRPRDPAATG
jgi:DNA-binding CsgD family transcriptional regulator/tetratricopeptide (TPR) repeat protein